MPNNNEEKKKQDEQNKDAAVKPDPATLHTTDPQRKMEGPVSSLVQDVKKKMNHGESKEEADRKKEENM